MTSPLVEVRPVREEDATAISEIYAPYVRETAISFEIEPPPPEAIRQRIAHTVLTYPWLVAHQNGDIIGYAYAGKHRERAAYRWAVDLAVYVHRDSRRHGIGHALYVPLLNMLRRQGFHSAVAEIALPNAGSVRLHESMEFVHIGTHPDAGFKFGRWHDIGYWRLGLSHGALPDQEPCRFRVFRETPEFAAALHARSNHSAEQCS